MASPFSKLLLNTLFTPKQTHFLRLSVTRSRSQESENIPKTKTMTETTNDTIIMQYTRANGIPNARPPNPTQSQRVGHPKPLTPAELLAKYVEADDYEDLPELPVAVRLDLAHQAFHNAIGKDRNIKDIARKHGVSYSTL
jgi:hypothetical protein